MRHWCGRVGRYLAVSTLVVGAVLLAAWPLLDGDGRRGLALAAGIAMAVQVLSFGALAALPQASQGFMAVWAGSTLVRFAVVGGVAFWVVGREGVDIVVALLALAGLFFVLLLLEPWALRGTEER